ncbi:TlpA family protein disulfide reductase [Bizionia gelidisalsuginis]|uniref:TlpA family protein disulfide reductase n=2 Tax=Bizionia TaxID=283785 RepID=A0A8H2QJM6_9FLAO|nr:MULTISPECIES: TlpA disulfide reductase family protein [Bizionia]TYB76033.1 TlpA family protein disulfide reductase [Bizionia saleffrena]TYC13536.1 TlpA family protein disulfide reductase [Bizionia gelidisalsuginis]
MKKNFLFILTFLPTLLLAQHTISGSFSPAKEYKFAFLYRVTPNAATFITNADVSSDGTFKMALDKSIVSGTFRLVYAQPQEDNYFDFIYNGKEDIAFDFNKNDGVKFTTSSENKMYASYNKSIALINQSIRNYYGSQKVDKDGYKSIFAILSKTQNEFEKASKGMLVNHFIKACRPYIPSVHEDVTTFSNNIKNYYFTNIDFSDDALQNSNFLIKNATSYVYGFVDRNVLNASYKENIDVAVKAIGNNPKVKKTILDIMWRKFAETGNESIANYITDNYLLDLAKADQDRKIMDAIVPFKNISLGKVAPDFDITLNINESTKLSALDSSENYILVFWSTNCSHCLEEVPQLEDYIKPIAKEKILVIAIALENDKARWDEMITDFPEFIHVFGEGKWNNEIGDNYNISGTPSYFILNSNKEIVAKPYDITSVKNYFDSRQVKTSKE